MARLAAFAYETMTAAAAAAVSQGALDRALAADAELHVAPLSGRAILLGAFQRTSELHDRTLPAFARGSGGPAILAGDGILFVHLALARLDALVPCDAERIVNRHVRPLLAAITKSAAPARYFGREFVSVAHRPAGLVAFAHDATTGRATFEAFVAVEATPYAGARASFMGKAPGTLAELAGKTVQIARVGRAVVDAYASAWDAEVRRVDAGAPEGAPPAPDEPPWTSIREDAIGAVAAGRDRAGVLRVGGELMASRDALAAAERGASRPGADASAVVRDAFAAPGVVLFGAKAETIAAALRDALGQ